MEVRVKIVRHARGEGEVVIWIAIEYPTTKDRAHCGYLEYTKACSWQFYMTLNDSRDVEA